MRWQLQQLAHLVGPNLVGPNLVGPNLTRMGGVLLTRQQQGLAAGQQMLVQQQQQQQQRTGQGWLRVQAALAGQWLLAGTCLACVSGCWARSRLLAAQPRTRQHY
jgi:ABC-type uncharacterized transport system permease subunit